MGPDLHYLGNDLADEPTTLPAKKDEEWGGTLVARKMLTRRILLGGLIAAPSIVRANLLMPIKPVIEFRDMIDVDYCEFVDFDYPNPEWVMKFAYNRQTRVWKPINDAAKTFWAGEWVKGKNHFGGVTFER